MKKFIISEEEKNRILGLHVEATKRHYGLVSEQQTFSKELPKGISEKLYAFENYEGFFAEDPNMFYYVSSGPANSAKSFTILKPIYSTNGDKFSLLSIGSGKVISGQQGIKGSFDLDSPQPSPPIKIEDVATMGEIAREQVKYLELYMEKVPQFAAVIDKMKTMTEFLNINTPQGVIREVYKAMGLVTT